MINFRLSMQSASQPGTPTKPSTAYIASTASSVSASKFDLKSGDSSLSMEPKKDEMKSTILFS